MTIFYLSNDVPICVTDFSYFHFSFLLMFVFKTGPKPNGCPINNDMEECGSNYKNGSILCAVCAWKSHAVRTDGSEFECVKCGDISKDARRNLILVVMSMFVVFALVIALYLHVETCSKVIDKVEEEAESMGEQEEDDKITVKAKKIVRQKMKRARKVARSIVTRVSWWFSLCCFMHIQTCVVMLRVFYPRFFSFSAHTYSFSLFRLKSWSRLCNVWLHFLLSTL